MKHNADGSITLCPMCIPFSCCPVVSKDKENKSINVSDDFGGSINIKEEEVKDFLDSINEFLSLRSTTLDS